MNITKNIVLIGLSGSGKTAFSKRLSERYGLPVVDMDSEIVKKAGKSINDIFAEQGEEAFRQMETECARECGKLTGTIISTGGGVVLREANMLALKRNGLVIFLDRLPEDILGEDLSDNKKIYRLREQRYPLYIRYADTVVRNCKAKEDTEAAIVAALEKLISEQPK